MGLKCIEDRNVVACQYYMFINCTASVYLAPIYFNRVRVDDELASRSLFHGKKDKRSCTTTSLIIYLNFISSIYCLGRTSVGPYIVIFASAFSLLNPRFEVEVRRQAAAFVVHLYSARCVVDSTRCFYEPDRIDPRNEQNFGKSSH